MEWIFILFLIAVIIFLIFSLKSRGKNPNEDASLTIEEEEELNKDYLSHGDIDDRHDNKNI